MRRKTGIQNEAVLLIFMQIHLSVKISDTGFLKRFMNPADQSAVHRKTLPVCDVPNITIQMAVCFPVTIMNP